MVKWGEFNLPLDILMLFSTWHNKDIPSEKDSKGLDLGFVKSSFNTWQKMNPLTISSVAGQTARNNKLFEPI